MEQPRNVDRYALKDIYLAAVIYARGIKLIGLEPAGNHFLFLFENKDACEKIASEYLRDECLVQAKTVTNAIRTLKDLVFSMR